MLAIIDYILKEYKPTHQKKIILTEQLLS